MALRALMLKKKIDLKKRELEEARASLKQIREDAANIETAIDEAQTEEEQKTVEEAIDAQEAAEAEATKKVADLEGEVADLEKELSECETEQEAPEEERGQKDTEIQERKVINMNKMETRDRLFGASIEERDALFAREDVQDYLLQVRTAIKEKRAIENAGLTIPEVFMGILRENLINYSKLYRHVTVRQISGDGRMVVMGAVPEAIWTECCANLNELSLTFNDVEVSCYKVGGFFAICNATLQDSDIDLAAEILTAAGQAIGKALDKAILYGKNTTENNKMPLGIVSRLAQKAQPGDYPQTARPWVDLHTKNILSIPAGTTGANLIAAIVMDFAPAKGKYSRGEKVFVMNENTYTRLGAATITRDATGRIVTGVFDQMPVIGGVIEVLDFVPDNVIIGGYFDLYLLAEREGQRFATSEHVRFLQDQTVMKGIARYDGTPMIAEAFVAIGLEGVTPTAEMTFAADTANAGA